ncbi:polysaccharide lyase family 7 protein [Pseudofrankia inefficax]|uniref:Alginate lyase 2 n=1 Tax=Pseudofrankia inefficax (strain DSM 45817 / CECT 9037 / DDB 130130 / EuI1c) TaxID=298654 RepID=E3J4S7_PSEI1|nr:polysaccharide lyase family 7 protein [Pseudofrankia inefficax]ADP78246.1 Alginate lyase 2 [Pseudofrankia inefficax]
MRPARGVLGVVLGMATLTACLPAPRLPPSQQGAAPRPVAPAGGPLPAALAPQAPAPSPAAGGVGAAAAGSSTAPVPAQILDLSKWKLTLPVTSAPGADSTNGREAAQISRPALRTFSMAPYFTPTGDNKGVHFRAPVNGATTPGSSYPRSELREMSADRVPAAWSSTTGTNTMSIREAITHLPTRKPEMVAGQIHDANGYVAMIRLDGSRLYVEHDGQNVGDLNTHYVLGTVFRIRMVAAGGLVSVYYNDKAPVTFPLREGGLYFKAGCYTQSNLSKGEPPDAYGEVALYDLRVSHS